MLGFSIHSNQYKFWRYWYPMRLTLKPHPSEYGEGYIWRWLWFVWGPEGSANLRVAGYIAVAYWVGTIIAHFARPYVFAAMGAN